MSALVDVTDTNYHENLYARYRVLRNEHPVYHDAQRNIWMITRYDDVRALLRNAAVACNADTGHSYLLSLTSLDGERHKELRGAVMPFFSQTAMASMKPALDALVAELFDRLPNQPEVELLNSVIKRLPQKFVTELLGFPKHLAPRWYELGDCLVGQDPLGEQPGAPEVALRLLDELQALMREALHWKRNKPEDDFFSWLSDSQTVQEHGEDGVITLANNIGLAALDTTINLLGNGTGLLARFPEQRKRLLDKPELLPGAIEEMLRIEAPTQALPRRLVADIDVQGVRIPAGEEISLVFAAANHDPAKYPQPEMFDIQRKNHDHLAFGFGLHKCVGQHLARMEAISYFSELLRRYPEYELGEHRWLLSHWARGYAALTIHGSA